MDAVLTASYKINILLKKKTCDKRLYLYVNVQDFGLYKNVCNEFSSIGNEQQTTATIIRFASTAWLRANRY